MALQGLPNYQRVSRKILWVSILVTGVLLALLNIPVIILGWFKVGKGFTIYSIISVAFTTIFLETIPFVKFSEEILLNAVFGGLLSGIGVGISLKWGASTGGMDIIAMILSRIKDRPIGIYFLVMNAMIIFFAGWLYDPEKAVIYFGDIVCNDSCN